MNGITLAILSLIVATQFVCGERINANVKLLPFNFLLSGDDSEILISLENIFQYYTVAKATKTESLKEDCLKFIDENAHDVMQLDGFLKLSVQDIQLIYSRKTLNAEEIEKLNVLAKLSKSSDIELDVIKKELLPLINFDEIGSRDLLEIVLPSGLYESQFVYDGWRIRIQTEVEDNFKKLSKTEEELTKTKKQLSKTEDELLTTKEELTETKEELVETKEKLEEKMSKNI